MKYILILFLSFLITNPVFSQNVIVEGKVSDPDSGKVIPFAQVAFYNENSQLPVTGATTNESGSFNISIQPGDYRMVVSFVGYEDYQQEVTVSSDGLDVGDIGLAEKEEVMDEVVVEGNERKRPVMATMEGMEIKPDQTISNVGGTLLDILRNTPSVNVSDDGSVSLRGSGSTNVLIDGRNSALASDLEQIPASAIETVEIMNNPNAKYDASADGGVINIKLKRGEDLGNTARAEVTMGTRMRTNANLNLSRRTTKYAVYGGYSYRKWPRVGDRITERNTTKDGVRKRLVEMSDSRREDSEHTVNYGADYFWGNSKISLEGVFNTEDEDDFESVRSKLTNLNENTVTTAYVRNNNETEKNYTYDNALIYERIYDNPDKLLRASISTSIRDQIENQKIDIFNNTQVAEGNPSRIEGSSTDEFRNTSVAQLDYSTPFFNGVVEAGYKSIFRNFDNDFKYGLGDPQTENFQSYDSISNRFIYQDQIHSLYAIFSDSIPNFNYAVGLRAEQTVVENELKNVESSLISEEDLNNQIIKAILIYFRVCSWPII